MDQTNSQCETGNGCEVRLVGPICRSLAFVIVWSFVISYGVRGESQTRNVDRQLLQQKGLIERESVWILPEETNVRSRVNELFQTRDRITDLSRRVAHLLKGNFRNRASAAIVENPRGHAANDLRKPKKGQRKSDISSVIRPLLVEETNLRSRSLLALLNLRASIERVNKAYEKLAGQSDVKSAIQGLGAPPHKLGPTFGYTMATTQLDKVESLVMSTDVPFFSQGGFPRVSGIVNEMIPVTFTWRGERDPTLITTSMARNIGVRPRPSATGKKLAVRDQIVDVIPATIDSLRFGKVVLRQIEVQILSPDAEHLGAQIGPAVFEAHDVRLNRSTYRLELRYSEPE